MKTKLPLTILFVLCAMLCFAQGTTQVIGEIQGISGGYEDMTTTPVYDNTAYTAGKSQWTRWDLDTYTYNSSNGRSSPKYITIGESSATSRLRSSTTGSTQIASNTQYVFQFYYKNTGNTNNLQVYLQPDGSTTLGTGTNITANNTSGAWTKVSGTVTSKTATPSDYGHFVFRFSGASGNNIDIDDVSIYQGSSADNTAPDAPANAEVGISSYASLYLNWDAPATGVDGGGYIIVYGTSDPTTAPNTNGIYAVGNTIGGGTVGYIGTNTHALITGLSKNTTYYFRVYTVDKAFNYSSAATASGTTCDLYSGDYRFTNGSGDSKWGTSLNWQTYNGSSWVTAITAPDDSTANVYISGYTVLFESNASCKNLTISQQNGYGSLLFDNNTTRSLTVYGYLSNAGLIRPVTTENTYGQSTIKTHTLTLRGSIINYGNFKTATDADGTSTTYKCMRIHLVFGGYTNSTYTNKGTSDLRYDITLNKTNASNTLTLASELALTEFTVTDNPTTPVFTFTKGKLVLGVNNFVLTPNTSITGESSNSYVQTNSTGKIIKKYASTGSPFTFPVGDGTYYTPYNFTLNSGTLDSDPYVAVRVINSAEPHVTSYSDYINRYWDVSTNDITNLNADASYIYIDNDITGTENNFLSVLWNSANGLQNAGTVNISTNTANCDELTATGNFTTAGICNFIADAGNDTIISIGDSVQIGSDPVSGYTYAWSPAEGLSSTTVANPWAKPDTAIIYTVTVTNIYGCEKTDDINITIVNINFIINPDTIYLWDSVTFSNISFGLPINSKYKWSFNPCLFSSDTTIVEICDTINIGTETQIMGYFDNTDSAEIILTAVDNNGNPLQYAPKIMNIAILTPLITCPSPSCHDSILYDPCNNIVCNGNFEWYQNCPNMPGELCYAEPWVTTPTNNPSSPDYYNACFVGPMNQWNVDVPVNFWGAVAPHSGNAYAGYLAYVAGSSNVNSREYIQAPLKTNLIAGQKYKVEMYVNLADHSLYKSNGVQVFFSDTLPQASGFSQPIYGVIGTPGYFDLAPYDANCIQNWNFWTKLSKVFIASSSNLSWISIGNFKTDNDTSFHYHSWNPGQYAVSMILVDDVSVKLAPDLVASPNDSICKGDTVTIYAHYPCSHTWSSVPYDPSLIGQEHNDTINVAPDVTTVYSISTGDPDIDTSITITVIQPPQIVINGTFNTCHGVTTDTILNYDSSYVYTYNIGHGTPVTITSNPFTVNWGNHLDGGMLYIEATNSFGCSAVDSFRVFGCCSTDYIWDVNLNDVNLNSDSTIYNKLVYVNGIVTISNNSTLNIIKCGVFLGPNTKINIDPGSTMNIDSNSVLMACDTMWDGIYLYDTTSLLTIKNYSIVRDAKNAIVSINGGVYELSNYAIMYQNYRNIVVDDYPYFHKGSISKSGIGSDTVLNPQWPPLYAPRSFSGVEMHKVNGIIIGDTTNYSYRNFFVNLDYGIIDSASTMYVYNNEFDSIRSVNAGKAIRVWGAKNNDAKAVIGGQSHGGYLLSNYFNECRYGIDTYGLVELTATNDTTANTVFASIYCYTNAYRHTNISFNLLKDGRYGVAVKQTSGTSDYFINNNRINNTLVGVGVENATPLSFDTLRVTANNINLTNPNGGRGVQFTNVKGAKGHWSVVSWNNIRFTHYPSGNWPTYFGIRYNNSPISYIENNTILRTTAGTPNDTANAHRLIGINTNQSSSVRIGKNNLNNMGYGIFCTGTEPATKIYCNKMDSCFHSIRLNAANISQQGSQYQPWDNEFTPQTPVHNRIFGSVVFAPPQSWYYQTGSNYSIIPYSVLFLNTFTATNSDYCSSMLMYDFDTIIVLQYLDTISLKYFDADIDTISVESDYQNVWAAYNILTDDDWLMKLGRQFDDTLELFYDNVKASNIGTIEKIYGYISDTDYVKAAQYNDELFANLTSESNIKNVNDVYLNSWADDIMHFSSADSSMLYDIAVQNPLLYGTGVYGARVLLGIDFDEEGNNLKIAPPVFGNPSIVEELLVYPNPSTGEINIYSNGTLLNQNVKLTVYNGFGYIVEEKDLKFDKEPLTISLNELKNGVYYYKLETLNNKYSGKIVIIK